MADGFANAPQDRGWQSDVIADLIRGFGFAYITLNPGASYRGLHDSLVNHNANEPPIADGSVWPMQPTCTSQ